jgi:hypothetical protein
MEMVEMGDERMSCLTIGTGDRGKKRREETYTPMMDSFFGAASLLMVVRGDQRSKD